MSLTKEQIEAMVKDIVSTADYDIGKQLDAETAEEPEFAARDLAALVRIAEKHLKRAEKKKT